MTELYVCTGASWCNSNACGHRNPHPLKNEEHDSSCTGKCPKGGHSCIKQIILRDNWDE